MEDTVRPSEPELSEALPHRTLGSPYQGPAGGLLCDSLCFKHPRTSFEVDNDPSASLLTCGDDADAKLGSEHAGRRGAVLEAAAPWGLVLNTVLYMASPMSMPATFAAAGCGLAMARPT
jgi:hypothetical protein